MSMTITRGIATVAMTPQTTRAAMRPLSTVLAVEEGTAQREQIQKLVAISHTPARGMSVICVLYLILF